MAADLATTKDFGPAIGWCYPAMVAEWLQQVWAQFSGIASRSDIFPVRSLVEQAATGDGERKVFDRDALTLSLALPSGMPTSWHVS